MIIYGPEVREEARTGQEQQLSSLFGTQAEAGGGGAKPQTFEVRACRPGPTPPQTRPSPIPAICPGWRLVHDLPESEKVALAARSWSASARKSAKNSTFVPAKIQVIRHIRPKYACRTCEGVEDDGPTVKTAVPMPPRLFLRASSARAY